MGPAEAVVGRVLEFTSESPRVVCVCAEYQCAECAPSGVEMEGASCVVVALRVRLNAEDYGSTGPIGSWWQLAFWLSFSHIH